MAFPIVAIGASAGGLEAFTKLLRHLPPDTGMAFVLVQHLDPKHESILASLLSRATKMTVGEAADKIAAPHTPFAGPAALASLHLLATAKEETYFAAIEPGEGRDLYGIGVSNWQPSVDVPTGPGLGFDPDPAFLRRHDCAKT